MRNTQENTHIAMVVTSASSLTMYPDQKIECFPDHLEF